MSFYFTLMVGQTCYTALIPTCIPIKDDFMPYLNQTLHFLIYPFCKQEQLRGGVGWSWGHFIFSAFFASCRLLLVLSYLNEISKKVLKDPDSECRYFSPFQSPIQRAHSHAAVNQKEHHDDLFCYITARKKEKKAASPSHSSDLHHFFSLSKIPFCFCCFLFIFLVWGK